MGNYILFAMWRSADPWFDGRVERDTDGNGLEKMGTGGEE